MILLNLLISRLIETQKKEGLIIEENHEINFFSCIIDYRFKNLKNQLSKANELGVIIVLIIGSEELTDRTVTIRNMVSEEQKTVDLDELINEIYDIIDQFSNNKFNQ